MVYHDSRLLPSHQISPIVAVFCSFLRAPGEWGKKYDGWAKSRRYSNLSCTPSAAWYVVVKVPSFKLCVRPLKSPPWSCKYSNLPDSQNLGEALYCRYRQPPVMRDAGAFDHA